MNVRDLFLEAVKASLEDRIIEWGESVSTEDWQHFFQIASKHNVLPMVFQSTYDSPVLKESAGNMIPLLRRSVMEQVFLQIRKNQEFLQLYRELSGKGLEPIVVKGAIVRSLYPNSDNRISGDEDFYIPAGTYNQYKDALAECHMTLAGWDAEKEESNHEVSYIHESGALKIEIHKDLFDSRLSAYSGMNDLFQDAFERSILVDIDGQPVRTMNHTDHMIFLVLHAFKHFVTSGFGIRQVCDMVVYGNHWGREIEWEELLDKCRSIHADQFAAAIFDIGRRYLGFDWEKSGYPELWQKIEVDSEDLLNDLIDAGIFGASDMSRKHSSNITLNAVTADKKGQKASTGRIQSAVKAVCLPVDKMSDRYPYLKKMPFLLPVAWIQRVWTYRKETAGNKSGNNAAESIKIGNERVELMRKYGIIK